MRNIFKIVLFINIELILNAKSENNIGDEPKEIERTVLLIDWPDKRSWLDKHKAKIAGAALGVIALPVVLPAMGFTAGGIAAGSMAAGIQSTIYGGATAGIFRFVDKSGSHPLIFLVFYRVWEQQESVVV